MKTNLHPNYHQDVVVTCTCGNKFTTGSTLKEIKTEICSSCHPFFTGELRYADTEGKVDSFQKKIAKAKKEAPELAKKKLKKKGIQPQTDTGPKSLKEMLMGAQ